VGGGLRSALGLEGHSDEALLDFDDDELELDYSYRESQTPEQNLAEDVYKYMEREFLPATGDVHAKDHLREIAQFGAEQPRVTSAEEILSFLLSMDRGPGFSPHAFISRLHAAVQRARAYRDRQTRMLG
jgi:hypothetical protein